MQKNINKIFKEVKNLHKSELELVKQLEKKIYFKIKNVADTKLVAFNKI